VQGLTFVIDQLGQTVMARDAIITELRVKIAELEAAANPAATQQKEGEQ